MKAMKVVKFMEEVLFLLKFAHLGVRLFLLILPEMMEEGSIYGATVLKLLKMSGVTLEFHMTTQSGR